MTLSYFYLILVKKADILNTVYQIFSRLQASSRSSDDQIELMQRLKADLSTFSQKNSDLKTRLEAAVPFFLPFTFHSSITYFFLVNVFVYHLLKILI